MTNSPPFAVPDLPEDQPDHHNYRCAAHVRRRRADQCPRPPAMRRRSATRLFASVPAEASGRILLLRPRHLPAEHPRHCLGTRTNEELATVDRIQEISVDDYAAHKHI